MTNIVQECSYSCFRCEHRFKTHHAGFLEEHILKEHFNSHCYKCSECDCRFGTKLATIWHIDDHHDRRERGRQIILTHDEGAEFLEIAIHREVMEYQRRFLHITADEWKLTVAAARLKKYSRDSQYPTAVQRNAIPMECDSTIPIASDERIHGEEAPTLTQQQQHRERLNDIPAPKHLTHQEAEQERCGNRKPTTSNVETPNENMHVDASDELEVPTNAVEPTPAAVQDERNITSTVHGASEERVYAEKESSLLQQNEQKTSRNDVPPPQPLPPQNEHSAVHDLQNATFSEASDKRSYGKEEQSCLQPQEHREHLNAPEHLPDEAHLQSQEVPARQCKECERWIRDSSEDLLRHANTAHLNLILYECLSCRKTYSSLENKQLLEHHINEMHRGDTNLLKDHRSFYASALKEIVDSCFGESVQNQVPNSSIQQAANCEKNYIIEVHQRRAKKRKQPLNEESTQVATPRALDNGNPVFGSPARKSRLSA